MLGNIGPWQLLIVLIIVVMVFGTKKLRNIGGDLGSAVKGFKKAMTAEEEENAKIEANKTQSDTSDSQTSNQATKQAKDVEKQREN